MPYHAPSHATLTRTSAIPYAPAFGLLACAICALTFAGLAFVAFTHANRPLQPSASPYKPNACVAATCARPTLRAALRAS